MNNKIIAKWFSLFLLMVVAGVGSAFAQKLSADKFVIQAGETKEITLKLEQGTETVYGVQTEIVLPASLQLVSAEAIPGIMEDESDATFAANGNKFIAFSQAGKAFKKDKTPTAIAKITVQAVESKITKNENVSIQFKSSFSVEGDKTVEVASNCEAFVQSLNPYNLDFALDTPIATGITTYAKDAKAGQFSGIQPVEGWKITSNGDARAAGVFAYGSTAFLGGTYKVKEGDKEVEKPYAAPAASFEGGAGQALGVLGVWTGSVQYTQTVVLPAGEYMLVVPVYNVGGKEAIVKNNIGVIVGEVENFATTTVYPEGKWVTDTIYFTLDAKQKVTLSLGYDSPNKGSGSCQHLFIDQVMIQDALAYNKAQAAAKVATLPVGDAIFYYPKKAVDAAVAAIAAAKTSAEVATALETVFAAQVKPELGKDYTIQQVASDKYLSVTNDAVVISASKTVLRFEAAEGGYYLTNGENYVGIAGTNKWSMSAYPNKKAVLQFTVVDGYYAIVESLGAIGTDETEDNSLCYANKEAAGNPLAQWYILRDVDFPVSVLKEVAEMANWTCTSGDTFHLNTWSTENDESGMKTPFIEAWRGSGNMLNNATIARKTIEGLTPGNYTVNIFARVFNENNKTDYPSGITFGANGVYVDLATAGKQALFNNKSAEVYGTFSVDCKVGAAGTLDINFILDGVVGDWLAFKNLEVIYHSTDVPVLVPVKDDKINAASAAAQKAAVDAFNAKPTIETYEAALAAIADAQGVADFYTANDKLIKALDKAGAAKFAEVEATGTTAAKLAEGLIVAQKAQTTAGADLSLVVLNSAWINRTGNYGSADERFKDSAYTGTIDAPTKVLYQKIEGLQEGTYEVKFLAVANSAWHGCATGDNIAQVFANTATFDIAVLDQTGCDPANYERKMTAVVGKDGILEYGLQNIGIGGNWYVAKAISLSLVELGAPVVPDPEPEPIPGDINGDEEVTVADVALAVDFILNKIILTYDQQALADLNGDGTVSIADVAALINKVLGKDVPTAAKNRAGILTDDKLIVNGTDVELVNARAYVGFQMDVKLANGATLNDVELAARAAGHILSYNEIADNTYRVLAFSMDNTTFSGNEGILLSFDVNGEKSMTLSNIEFTDAAAAAYALGVTDVTAIKAVEVDAQKTAVFDLNGRRVNNVMKGGLYVIEGKKVIVK